LRVWGRGCINLPPLSLVSLDHRPDIPPSAVFDDDVNPLLISHDNCVVVLDNVRVVHLAKNIDLVQGVGFRV